MHLAHLCFEEVNLKSILNGARDLLILNWFEESVAGRQGKGRQLDFRHGRHLDAPGPLSSYPVTRKDSQYPVVVVLMIKIRKL